MTAAEERYAAVRAAADGPSALDALFRVDPPRAIRAALAITRRALALQAPRPRHFSTPSDEAAWSDAGSATVTEALAVIEALGEAVERDDAAAEAAARERGRALAPAVEAYIETVAAAADAYDYDAGSLVVSVASALLEALCTGESALGQVAARAAWMVPSAEERGLAKAASTWDERLRRRTVALRADVLAALPA